MIDPNAGFFGLYRGNVYSNKDPLNQGRLRLRVPQVLADQITDWAWGVDTSATDFEVPSVGQGIWVAFEGGNPSFPIWVGTFGTDKTGNIPLYMEHLSSEEDISQVTDYLVIEALNNGTSQLNVTQTLLKLAKKAILAPSAHYGAFHSDQTQTNPVANTPRAMTFNVTETSSGVSIVSDSRITIHNPGIYNIQFSAQLEKTDSGTDDVDIWMRHQGADVINSNTSLTLSGNNVKLVAAWNFFVQSTTVDQYWEIMWASADVDMRILAQTAQTTPFAHPGIPSIILTVQRVN